MAWWQIRGHEREVSRSMVALVVSAAAALILGGMTWVPKWLAVDNGVTAVEPGLFTISKSVTGVATLGRGFTVSLYPSGFRYSLNEQVLADTVTRGAPVSALLGSVSRDDEPREDINDTLSDVRIDTLDLRPGIATYRGTVSGTVDGKPRTLPLRWQVTLSGQSLATTISIQGADGMAVSLDWYPNVQGIPPALPDRNLKLKSWWLGEQAPDDLAFTWFLGSSVGIGPQDVPRALDDNVDGRVDMHIWNPLGRFIVSANEPQPNT